MTWTKWTFIADADNYFEDNLPDWRGPACYELGLGKTKNKIHKIVYVGETSTLRTRIIAYATHGSQLEYVIDDALQSGNYLFFRYMFKKTKNQAIITQNNLLDKYEYEWNISFNL